MNRRARHPGGHRRITAGECTGIGFGLNHADLINLTVGESMHLEVLSAVVGDTLIAYPLDHFGSDVRRTIKFDAPTDVTAN